MYKKILVPVDGSEENGRAIEEAARMKAVMDARVLLLHVIDPLWYSHGMERHSVFVNDVLPAMRRHGAEILDAARKRLGQDDASIEVLLEECEDRRIPDVVVARAQQWGADLVVMGTRGRRGLDRMFMGSVAEGVARTSPVPVLLVRPAPGAGA
ncbi:universal stress protein [Achromobacter aloeverae]|nr:universal stress protein [Achromobacter aloeverae]